MEHWAYVPKLERCCVRWNTDWQNKSASSKSSRAWLRHARVQAALISSFPASSLSPCHSLSHCTRVRSETSEKRSKPAHPITNRKKPNTANTMKPVRCNTLTLNSGKDFPFITIYVHSAAKGCQRTPESLASSAPLLQTKPQNDGIMEATASLRESTDEVPLTCSNRPKQHGLNCRWQCDNSFRRRCGIAQSRRFVPHSL